MTNECDTSDNITDNEEDLKPKKSSKEDKDEDIIQGDDYNSQTIVSLEYNEQTHVGKVPKKESEVTLPDDDMEEDSSRFGLSYHKQGKHHNADYLKQRLNMIDPQKTHFKSAKMRLEQGWSRSKQGWSRSKKMTIKGLKTCDKCEWSGNSQSALWYHRQKIHVKIFMNCKYCNYKSLRPLHLEIHTLNNHSDKMVRAPQNKISGHENIETTTNRKEDLKNITLDIDTQDKAPHRVNEMDANTDDKNEATEHKAMNKADAIKDKDIKEDAKSIIDLPPKWREEGGTLIFSPPGAEAREFLSRREAVLWLVASGEARPQDIFTLWAGLGREGWKTDPLLPAGWLRSGDFSSLFLITARQNTENWA